MLPGKRIMFTKWIAGRTCAVRVHVEGVIPPAKGPDDAGEPCLEPTTLKLLDELQRLADDGDVGALARAGEVFVRKSA